MSQTTAITPEQAAADNKSLFGFWAYLMTDVVLFASLFATFAVLRNNTFGGPSGGQLFSLPFVLTETLVLLTSSFTCGLALVAANRGRKGLVLGLLGATFALGATFLALELSEFSRLVHEGHSWQASGFLSSFFTLVGTHGLHITMGLIWLLIMMLQLARRGLGRHTLRRLSMFGLFWHFLDIIWIFIFTVVYLVGAV